MHARDLTYACAWPACVRDASGNADADKLALSAECIVLNITGSLIGEACRVAAVNHIDVAAERVKWAKVFPQADDLARAESKPMPFDNNARDFKEFEPHEASRTDNVLVRPTWSGGGGALGTVSGGPL